MFSFHISRIIWSLVVGFHRESGTSRKVRIFLTFLWLWKSSVWISVLPMKIVSESVTKIWVLLSGRVTKVLWTGSRLVNIVESEQTWQSLVQANDYVLTKSWWVLLESWRVSNRKTNVKTTVRLFLFPPNRKKVIWLGDVWWCVTTYKWKQPHMHLTLSWLGNLLNYPLKFACQIYLLFFLLYVIYVEIKKSLLGAINVDILIVQTSPFDVVSNHHSINQKCLANWFTIC